MKSKAVWVISAFCTLVLVACNLPARNAPVPMAVSLTNATPVPVAPSITAPPPTESKAPAPSKVAPPTSTKTVPPTPVKIAPSTKTRTPTPTATIANNFSPDTASGIQPEDVLEEISYLGIGGGPECLDVYSQPVITTDPVDSELMILVRFFTCGWKNVQNVKSTITDPNGKVKNGTLTISQNGAVLAFRANLSDPVGLYTFRLASKEAKLESNVYFRQPQGPHLYILNNEHILLSGFKPRENVKLLYYKKVADTHRFSGLSTYQTDKNGQLEVEVSVGQKKDEFINGDVHTFVAIGEKSGEVHLLHNLSTGGVYTLFGKSITGQPLSAVAGTAEKYTLNCSAQQIASSHYKYGNKINIGKDTQEYANPRTNARMVGTLRAGSQASLFDPLCVNKQVWWLTSSGYVAETTLVKNEKAAQPVCSGLKSRLNVGMRVRVAFTDGTDMRLRAKPGFTQTILYSIPEGTPLTILSGPQCADKATWWYIRIDNKREGWMAEYQGNTYLLEPAP